MKERRNTTLGLPWRDVHVPGKRVRTSWAAILIAALAFDPTPMRASAQLTPAAEAAFNRYVQLTEPGIPDVFSAEEKARLRKGQRLLYDRQTKDNGKPIDAPHALIQDWVGGIFLPNATLGDVRSTMENYAGYKNLFAPEVIESKILRHTGNDYLVFLRLFKRQILTVVLDSTYAIHYSTPAANRLAIDSRSTRIVEIENWKEPNEKETPAGEEEGFLWRLNSYWRFEQADGGVYARCQALSLSRDVPLGLAFMLGGFLSKFPRQSMENTLAGLSTGVRRRVPAVN